MNPSPSRPRIAVDAMGGDFGPHVVVPGAVQAARREQYDLLLVGDEPRIAAELSKLDTRGIVVRIVHATQVADMHDKPSEALRKKKDSSIQVCCNLVRGEQADGLISAGNTGVVLACSLFTLGRLEGVDRPALVTILPTERSPCVLVDAGANVDCKAINLMQFGIMADVMSRVLLGCQEPRVALLSNGEEEGKGNQLVKEAFDLFKHCSLNFVGNIEGRDIFTGEVDVVVCDGFVGNVAIKQAEGLASSLGRLLKGELRRGFFAKIGTTLALSALKRFSRLMDYAEYGGAPLLGLNGTVIVSHGASNQKAIANAVDMAGKLVRKDTAHLLKEGLAANKDFALYTKRTAQAG
ncbi:Phosphate acyltransferase [Fundidesulfovibrio magnetotacticus]|uniref:Phosphate acyltransferase n=1 Tax=Fundidesulfovibrio magnetotacticus TaxID=2730080 RepID=A0A6V8M184_9BACT|nr:phosphate acyltransferase PlsX [Fundidesulfovibrio magnetotacticus]GFK95617.1 Phosphate acyltransferase [Fundidesulfovibrio magnetotacticus]